MFRRGGPLRKTEKWFYDGQPIECVSVYKYLGILFCSTLKWHKATEQLAQQAQKALFKIHQLERKCGGIPHNVYFNLFDKMVSPILCYGAEIWGYDVKENIEILHRKFCRRLLGVKRNTPTASVLGDCGRLPLMYTYNKKCITYWLKLLDMSNDRLPKQCYLLNKKLYESGYDTWAGRVKLLLDKYGFSYAWINQSVNDKHIFLSEFSQRIRDCYVQGWHETVSGGSKLQFYKNKL